MPSKKTQVIGAAKTAAALKAMGPRLAQAAAAALYLEGEAIMRESKADYVPVDDSDLKNSGRVLPPKRASRGDIEVSMGFGGQAAKHALPVHEHPSSSSPRSWGQKPVASAEGKDEKKRRAIPGYVTFHPVGHGPKYLEKPLTKAEDGMAQRIGQRIKAQTGI